MIKAKRKQRSLTRKSLIYSIGPVISAIYYLILIPVYSKYLTPEDYGNYEYSFAFFTVLRGVIFLDICFTILRFMYGKNNENEESHNKALFNGMAIAIPSSLIFIIGSLIAKNFFTIPFFATAISYNIIRTLSEIYTSFIRGKDEELLYTTGNVISIIISLLSSLLFIIIFKWGAISIFIGANLGYLIQCIYWEIKVHIFKDLKDFKKYIDKKILKQMIVFSIPLAFNSLAYWFMNYYSRIAIEANLSSRENGLYGMAITIANGIPTIASSILLAWEEIALSKQGSYIEKKAFFSDAIKKLVKVLTLCYIVYLSGVYIIFPYYVNNNYIEIKPLLPVIIAGTIMTCFKSFTVSIFGNEIDSKPIVISSFSGALFNFLTINYLIKSYGALGAGVAFLGGYFISTAISIIWLAFKQKYKIPIFTLIFSLAISILTALLCSKDIFWINLSILITGTIVMIILLRSLIFKRNRTTDE